MDSSHASYDRVTTQQVDVERWPNLLEPPHARFQSLRARKFTERLERLLTSHGVELDTSAVPNLVMKDGEVIDRATANGWLGLAEGYMLGEWTAEPLSQVLGVLLSQPLESRQMEILGKSRKNHHQFGDVRPGELPVGLVELFAGETRATGGALFSSGARTTATEEFSDGNVTYPMDVTWMGAPEEVDRRDLDDAQRRRINAMLDEASVGPGDRVLEIPSSGGELAIMAARRGASVDVLTSDEEHADAVEARAIAEGVAGAIHVEVISGPIPSPRQWAGRYQAIFSIERMETYGRGGLRHFLRALDRMLAKDGLAIVQSLVASGDADDRQRTNDSLDVMRAYVWPCLLYTSPSPRD